MGDRRILDSYYWNTNGMAISIVAVEGGIDWAAYIGATDKVEHEIDAHLWTLDYGAKLSESFARSLFKVDMPYRS